MKFAFLSFFLVLSSVTLGIAQNGTANKPAEEPYQLGPDSQAKEDVPQGKVLDRGFFTDSKIFPNTTRQWWIYVPAQYSADKPANLMVFQDGHDYVNPKGNWRVPTVFDNLINQGHLPVTIAVFINPGHVGSQDELKSPWRSSNRGIEYNKLSDAYARFLLDEILPRVQAEYSISKDPQNWAIGGASSGAIAAFTTAWQKPDKFRKVFSTIGSYVDLDGGHAYPSLVRRADPKPLRVFLQDGSNDLDNTFGNWPLANQMMHRALLYKGYDVKFEYGVGAHNSKHGGAIFPEAMKWLWRK